DSFIWKVRSRDVRTALGISEKTSSAPAPVAALREPAAKGAAHAIAYFGLPLAFVAVLGARSRNVPPGSEIASLAHEALLFPRSAIGNVAYGQAALRAGDAVTAGRELQRAADLA